MIYIFILYAIISLIWNVSIKQILGKIKKSDVVNEDSVNTVFKYLAKSAIIFAIPRFLFIAFSIYTLSTYTNSSILFIVYALLLFLTEAPIGMAFISTYYLGFSGGLPFIIYGVLIVLSNYIFSFTEKDVEDVIKKVVAFNHNNSNDTIHIDMLNDIVDIEPKDISEN